MTKKQKEEKLEKEKKKEEEKKKLLIDWSEDENEEAEEFKKIQVRLIKSVTWTEKKPPAPPGQFPKYAPVYTLQSIKLIP